MLFRFHILNVNANDVQDEDCGLATVSYDVMNQCHLM